MDASNDLERAWVAVYVRAHHEQHVANQLRFYGYEPFLPSYVKTSTRKSRLPTPLFPGYVFCRYVLHPVFRIIQIPGVIRILSHGRVPAVLTESEIETIQRMASLEDHVEPWRFPQIGQRVRITGGPLRGIEGILVNLENRLRMVVAVSLLRRAVAVKVVAEQLALVPEHA